MLCKKSADGSKFGILIGYPDRPTHKFSSEKYGEKGNECSDSLLLYGRCLLELGRAENCVLGNALKE